MLHRASNGNIQEWAFTERLAPQNSDWTEVFDFVHGFRVFGNPEIPDPQVQAKGSFLQLRYHFIIDHD